jgi:hypothetical protein
MSENPDRNIKNDRLLSQLSARFKRCGIYGQQGFEQEDTQAVLRATGENEATKKTFKTDKN